MYMWYYTVYSTALLHVVHDVLAGILGLQLFIYAGYYVHVIIYVYMTLRGLYPFAQIDCIAALPLFPPCTALCSYSCRRVK